MAYPTELDRIRVSSAIIHRRSVQTSIKSISVSYLANSPLKSVARPRFFFFFCSSDVFFFFFLSVTHNSRRIKTNGQIVCVAHRENTTKCTYFFLYFYYDINVGQIIRHCVLCGEFTVRIIFQSNGLTVHYIR